jgi:hypothetical protein
MYHLLRNKKQQLIGTVAVFIFLLSFLASHAQLRDEVNLPDNDEKPYHIGIVVMGVSSRFQVFHHANFLASDSVLAVYPENSGGLGLGGMHTFRISPHFDARVIFPQLIFSNKILTYHLKYPASGESAYTQKTVESILLGIPVQIKFKSDRINNFRVYMMGGFKYETDLASKARAKNADDMVRLKSSEIGVEAGIGFNFFMRYFILSPEIKVSNGISNVLVRDPSLKFSNVLEKLQTRMIVFSLIFEG